MTTISHLCNDTRESCRSSLVGIELDDTQTQMLLSIVRKHCKLALEHSHANTTRERRQEIIEEIQSLRSIRDDLIEKWREQVN
ncbi:hypothetical protein [Paenibacillus sp. MSJ-34]|uniref:hypothetical protein n=1 Tax=Paenibacillus sp. MSJ-34 TaxID=2841529 RepID=UPI001C1273DB|nr:hypothetical protein [Paenibacillus sp. MSJ-34]MBU5443541.1 hypothetical protein [Paenibacillus sp. MSJ-34]